MGAWVWVRGAARATLITLLVRSRRCRCGAGGRSLASPLSPSRTPPPQRTCTSRVASRRRSRSHGCTYAPVAATSCSTLKCASVNVGSERAASAGAGRLGMTAGWGGARNGMSGWARARSRHVWSPPPGVVIGAHPAAAPAAPRRWRRPCVRDGVARAAQALRGGHARVRRAQGGARGTRRRRRFHQKRWVDAAGLGRRPRGRAGVGGVDAARSRTACQVARGSAGAGPGRHPASRTEVRCESQWGGRAALVRAVWRSYTKGFGTAAA
jgi:hypothetical protein